MTPTLHHLKTYPMPQSDRVLLGLAWGQPPRTCLKPGKIGQYPPTPTPTVKTEAQPKVPVISCTMAMPKQVAEKCSWGLHCPKFD